jgi:hypothetical protein
MHFLIHQKLKNFHGFVHGKIEQLSFIFSSFYTYNLERNKHIYFSNKTVNRSSFNKLRFESSAHT